MKSYVIDQTVQAVICAETPEDALDKLRATMKIDVNSGSPHYDAVVSKPRVIDIRIEEN